MTLSAASLHRLPASAFAGEHAGADPEARRKASLINILTVTLILCILTQKLAVPLGEKGLELPVLITYGMIFILLRKKYIVFSLLRTALFCAFISALTLVTIFNNFSFSFPSIAAMILIYAIYVFVIPFDKESYRTLMSRFQIICLIVAGLVCFNWTLNLLHVPPINLDNYIPEVFRFKNYVYIQPVEWGSPYTKPNAIFFLETSHTGQFLALGLIVEFCLFQRFILMGVFAAAVLLTFSGTGTLLVVLTVPLLFFYLKPAHRLAVILAIPVLLMVAFATGLIDHAAKRSTEFSKHGQSGNGRFVAPFQMIEESVAEGSIGQSLFGIGAGNGKKGEDVLLNPVSKVIIEYGIVGTVAWFTFITVAMFGGGTPLAIAWALFVQYHLLNGSLLVPIHTLYCFYLGGAYVYMKKGQDEQPVMLSDRRDEGPEPSSPPMEPAFAAAMGPSWRK